jgi:MerR family transcriptional regulator, heat shock protein HspR
MHTALSLFEPDPRVAYPIEEVARLTHLPRHTIGVYCRWGLLRPAQDPDSGGWFFGDDAIRTLRRIEYLRQERGINLAGIRMIFDLVAELDQLREELRFLRGG